MKKSYLILLIGFLLVIIYNEVNNKVLDNTNIVVNYNKYLEDELNTLRSFKVNDNLDLVLTKVKYRNMYGSDLVIYRGFNDLIKKNDAILTNDGLVGIVKKTYSDSSIVDLITSRDSAISVSIGDYFGILKCINNELVIKILQKENLNKRFPTISIYSKNLEEMSNQELFSFITELYFQTGDVYHYSKVKDYIIGKELLLSDKYMLVNTNARKLFIDANSNLINEEFLKNLSYSLFNGITNKIEEGLNKEGKVNFNVLLSNKTSINAYENRLGVTYFLLLEDNKLGKAIYNYLLECVFDKDLINSKIKFDNSKNCCNISIEDLSIFINSKKLVDELNNLGLLEEVYKKEENMKRQLKWEE